MHWPRLVNLLMVTLAALTAIFALVAWWPSPGIDPLLRERLPLNRERTFELPPEAYAQIGKGPLALNRVMPQPQLPELGAELIYLGTNGRPDASDEQLYLTTKGGSDPVRISVGEPQYLELASEGFAFAPGKTHLWITPKTAIGKELILEVGMETPEGDLVHVPEERERITLSQQEVRKGAVWQMGQTRVDSSLLARQRARWYGEDRFLAEHGGEEYVQAMGRERIDLGEGPAIYSCFMRVGEGLIWKGERWASSPFGEESRGFPLLVLTKSEERALHFELWDESGRMKTPITVMRSKEGWMPGHLKEALRFVAAKTWSQFVVEWGGERMHVRPGDWILLEKEGWKVLATSEQVLDYAAGRTCGELLVIEGLVRSEGKHLLQGHLFNTTRSDRIPFEIPLTLELRPGAGPVGQAPFARKQGTAEMPPPKPADDAGTPITIQVRGALKEEVL